jgi:hypothetical protein
MRNISKKTKPDGDHQKLEYCNTIAENVWRKIVMTLKLRKINLICFLLILFIWKSQNLKVPSIDNSKGGLPW